MATAILPAHNDFSLLFEQVCYACAVVNLNEQTIRVIVNSLQPRENGETYAYTDYYITHFLNLKSLHPEQYERLSLERLQQLYKDKGQEHFEFEPLDQPNLSFTLDIYVPEVNVQAVYIVCRRERKADLLSAIAQQFIYAHCDYFIYIDARQNSYISFAMADKSSTKPPMFCSDYDETIIEYAYTYCTPEEQENTIYEMTLARVIDQLDKYGVHSFYSSIYEDGEIHRKYLEFRYFNKEEKMILLFRSDVTDVYNEENQYAQKLQAAINQAYTDSLTGILNAQGMQDHVNEKLQALRAEAIAGNGFSASEPSLSALLFIDLDNFKQVNDQCGHLMGDQILKDIAAVIKDNLRAKDFAGRIGGDEFEAFICHLDSRKDALDICHRILYAIEDLPQKHNFNVPLSCSIGVAFSPDDGLQYADLVHIADERVYAAKHRGKRTVVID